MDGHSLDLTNLAIVVAAAVLFGLAFIRAHLPSMVGFIVAGVMLGPTGLGLVSNSQSVGALAELGVLMLLFIAGLELSVPSFVRVLRPAAIAVVVQTLGALSLAFAMSGIFGWDWRACILFGFIITMSSTAVAIRIITELKETKSAIGELTVGLMIAQDIAVVPMLIFVESLEQETIAIAPMLIRLTVALGILAFVLYFFRAGREMNAPFSERLRGRDDLVALLALAACFATASLGGVLDLSPAYGAFVAGLVVGNTNLQSETMRVVTPIQSLLLVVFFLSVGLLIDLRYIADNAILVLGAAFGIILFKTGLNLISLRLAGVETARASQVGLATAQIGEFSFILAAAGLSASVLDDDRYRFAITVIAATLVVSPIWMIIARRIHDRALASLPIFQNNETN
ncbi:MAG: cation:proton antiporter [Hyphomonadaceae bacterium]